MAFNIKSEETHRLAREVADLAGESMAQAVDTALRERRSRLERRGIADQICELAREMSALIPPGVDLHKAAEDLYDEHGLPK